jgi:hypothetical protein
MATLHAPHLDNSSVYWTITKYARFSLAAEATGALIKA